jgi:hypothetical protein
VVALPTRRASANAVNTRLGAAWKRRRTSAMVSLAIIGFALRQEAIKLRDRSDSQGLVTGDPPLGVLRRRRNRWTRPSMDRSTSAACSSTLRCFEMVGCDGARGPRRI